MSDGVKIQSASGRKKKAVRARGGRKMRGRGDQLGQGWLGDAWNKAKEVARKVHDKAKERKVISTALRDVLGKDSSLAQFAKNQGYGRRRRRKQRGAGIGGDIGSWLGDRAEGGIRSFFGFGRGASGYNTMPRSVVPFVPR